MMRLLILRAPKEWPSTVLIEPQSQTHPPGAPAETSDLEHGFAVRMFMFRVGLAARFDLSKDFDFFFFVGPLLRSSTRSPAEMPYSTAQKRLQVNVSTSHDHWQPIRASSPSAKQAAFAAALSHSWHLLPKQGNWT